MPRPKKRLCFLVDCIGQPVPAYSSEPRLFPVLCLVYHFHIALSRETKLGRSIYMTSKSRFALVAVIAVALLLTSCAGQQVYSLEQQPAQQLVSPEPRPPEQEENAVLPPDYETAQEEQVSTIATAAAQIYYDFFSSSFEIVEYVSIHGPWQLWGHGMADELRLTKIVFINLIEGFADSVLVLFEFTLQEDGVTINYGLLNAYLIRDGELCSDISSAEFDMIFIDIEYERAWPVRDHDGVFRNMDVNGENLFFFDFAGASTEELMDMLLDKLREHI